MILSEVACGWGLTLLLSSTSQAANNAIANASPKKTIVTREMGSMCGAADNLQYAQSISKIVEFHIFPPEPGIADPLFPAGEMVLTFCGMWPSEMDSVDGPRLRREIELKASIPEAPKDVLEALERLQQPARPQP